MKVSPTQRWVDKARKQFFFEKKNQKTFAPSRCQHLRSMDCTEPPGQARSKGFLVLFFKKELLAFLAFLLLLIYSTQSPGFEFSEGDFSVRWDTSLRATVALRVRNPDQALLADPNADDGDRAFRSGPVSERLDVFSELDIARGDLGVAVSADGWYDAAYQGHSDNTSPATFNPVSVHNTDFLNAVRDLQGRAVELATAYVHDKFFVGEMPLTIRLGRQTLLWGESLFFAENGIAAGQAPVDEIKAISQPLAESKEVFLPVTQAVVNLQLRPGLGVEAYVQGEWRRNRTPGVASFFSTADFLDVGGQRLFEDGAFLARAADRTPHGVGQFGGAVRLTSTTTDIGFYALRFDAKYPALFVIPDAARGAGAAGRYGLVFPRGISLYGASFSSYLGDANIAGEISLRRNMPLISKTPVYAGNGSDFLDAATPYASGTTLHGQVSIEAMLPPGRFWQGAGLQAEFSANDRLAVTHYKEALTPGRNHLAGSFRVVFTPQYFEVLPHLDLTPVFGVGANLFGNSSVIADEVAQTGDVDIGVQATYRTVWEAALNVTHFVGNVSRQPLADRDFATFTVSRTF